MAVQESAGQSHEALQTANEQRTIEASRRNRKMAATALMRLGGDCPPEWEDVATELILHSQYSWSQIAHRLGVTRARPSTGSGGCSAQPAWTTAAYRARTCPVRGGPDGVQRQAWRQPRILLDLDASLPSIYLGLGLT
jgi:hypothetical protein